MRIPMLLAMSCAAGVAGLIAAPPPDAPARGFSVVIVVGAAGADEYEEPFAKQAKSWTDACAAAGVSAEVIGTETAAGDAQSDAKQLETRLAKAAAEAPRGLWLVLIGHGTFDGREARFNLRGPDITPNQLRDWLKPVTQETVIIHTGSASGAFVKPLSGPQRIIVTATKSGDEVFYPRFGEFFAPAIAGEAGADIDGDDQISILEAFLHAGKKTADFYEQEGRIATEHALIEDNADGVGTRAEAFEGTKSKEAKADGARARQLCLVLSEEEARLTAARRKLRDELERKLEELKSQRAALGDAEYYTRLEKLMRELGQVYRDDT